MLFDFLCPYKFSFTLMDGIRNIKRLKQTHIMNHVSGSIHESIVQRIFGCTDVCAVLTCTPQWNAKCPHLHSRLTLVHAFILISQQASPFQICHVLGHLRHVVADHVHAVVRRRVFDVVDVGVIELHDRARFLHLKTEQN